MPMAPNQKNKTNQPNKKEHVCYLFPLTTGVYQIYFIFCFLLEQ